MTMGCGGLPLMSRSRRVTVIFATRSSPVGFAATATEAGPVPSRIGLITVAQDAPEVVCHSQYDSVVTTEPTKSSASGPVVIDREATVNGQRGRLVPSC